MKVEQAITLAAKYDITLDLDFCTLSSEAVDRVLQAADEYGYRKPKNANGSRGRYFYAFLNRSAKSVKREK